MVAMTVQGPSMPRTVELVDPRSRTWEHIDRDRRAVVRIRRGPAAGDDHGARRPDLTAWLYRSPEGSGRLGAMIYLHGGPEGQARPEYSEIFPELLDAGHHAC